MIGSTIKFTGKEISAEDFRKILLALKTKYCSDKKEPSSNPPLLFSQSQKAATKATPIIFLDIDGVCWLDSTFESNDKFDELSCDYNIEELMSEHQEMMRQHLGNTVYDNYFLKTACFDPQCMQRIEQLCLQFGARIVISSTWRCNISIQALKNLFDLWNLGDPIIDGTPDIRQEQRELEIQTWIDKNPEKINGFVVLDDYYEKNLTNAFGDKFIHCEWPSKFDDEAFFRASESLRRQLEPKSGQKKSGKIFITYNQS